RRWPSSSAWPSASTTTPPGARPSPAWRWPSSSSCSRSRRSAAPCAAPATATRRDRRRGLVVARLVAGGARVVLAHDVALDRRPGVLQPRHGDAVVGDQPPLLAVEVEDGRGERLRLLALAAAQAGAAGRPLDQQQRALAALPGRLVRRRRALVAAALGLVLGLVGGLDHRHVRLVGVA